MPRRDRIVSLDGLRALAVLAVIALHAGLPFAHGGGVGVRVFFVLSGFLITTLLLGEAGRTGTVRLRLFYGRRVLRLLPALALLLVAVDVTALLTPHLHGSVAATPAVLFYAGNWVRAFGGYGHLGGFEHTWSLSVEEQFYLLWPLVLVAALRRGGRRLVLVAALGGSLGAVLLRAALWDGPASRYRLYDGTFSQGDQLLLGCALAALLAAGPGRRLRAVLHRGHWPAVAALLAVVVAGRALGSGASAGWFTVLGWAGCAVAAAVVIGHLVMVPGGPLSRALSWPPLRHVGRISYGVYLYHYPLLAVLDDVWPGLGAGETFLVGTAGALVAAELSFRLVERPLQRRLHPRLRPPGRAVPAPA